MSAGVRRAGLMFVVALACAPLAAASAGAGQDRPTQLTRPRIAGDPEYRHTLTAKAGSGAPQRAAAFQWQRCPDGPAQHDEACRDIAGATGVTYKVRAADAGSRMRVVETISAPTGILSRVSASTLPVVAILTYEEAKAAGLPVPPPEFGLTCPDDFNWPGYATDEELEAALAVAPEEPTCMDDPTEDVFGYGIPEASGPAPAWSSFGP